MMLKKQIKSVVNSISQVYKKSFCSQVTRVAGSEIIGIDLGTTNSCVAVVQRHGAQVIENAEGKRTTPSAVAFDKEGYPIVGQAARNQAVINPENTFYGTKRLIGKRFTDKDVQKEMKMINYKIVESDKGDAWVQTKEGKKYSPSQIGAYILMKMKDTAEAFVGKELSKAVITVPAYFNDQQRQATKDAGTIAGLSVLRIINEPTAAALAYGINKSGNKNIAVYDLGGGTFDISILHIGDGVFEVKATNGDTSCGGEDIDGVVQTFLLKEFKDISKMDVSSDKVASQRIREAAEKAKIELSQNDVTEIYLPYLANDSSGPKHFRYQLTRSKFEQLVGTFLQKTLEPCKQCLKDSGYSVEQIDEVLLVGGSSRIPYVQKLVQDFFKKQPNKSVNPDEAVALGAAIQGSVLQGTMKDLVLLDVTPLSLGKSIIGDLMSVIIPRNTPIPCSKTKTYTTTKDNQTKIDIIIYQGEREVASRNKELGRFVLDKIPMARKSVPKVDVTFNLDQNGILNVIAKEVGTGKQKQISIQHQGGLTSGEIEAMIKDAQKHRRYDEKLRQLTQLRNESENLVQQISKELETHKESLSKEVMQQISTEVEKLRELVKKKSQFQDIPALEEQLKITKEAGFKIGESIYEKHQRTQHSSEDKS